MNPYLQKLLEFLSSLMILIPCVLLLAWEDTIPYLGFFWSVLLFSNGILLYALYTRECKQSCLTLKRFWGNYGGFCIMFFFVLYKTITVTL